MTQTASAPEPWPKFLLRHWATFGLIAIFFAAEASLFLWLTRGPKISTEPSGMYGAQTDAWFSGQTSLKIQPSPELAKLSDPYDAQQNAPYRVMDLSYYRGKYFLYGGCGPIIMLFGPWRLATGTYLTEPTAVAVFDLSASLLCLGTLVAAWRRHFPGASGWLISGGSLAVSLGNTALIHLDRVDWHEVTQSSATFCTIAAAAAAFISLGSRRRAGAWLAASGAACGMAVACRPSFLPVAILPFPICVALSYADEREAPANVFGRFVRWAVRPALWLALAAVGLLIYNQIRFGSPFESGGRLELNGDAMVHRQMFSTRFLAENLARFCLTPPVFRHYFPFVRTDGANPLGVITGLPFGLWSMGMLALPWAAAAWHRRKLAAFALSMSLSTGGLCALLCLFFYHEARYEADFVIPLMLVAALGWLTAASASETKPPIRRVIIAGGWATAAFSAAMSVCFAFSRLNPELLSGIATWANAPIYALDQLRGIKFGPVRLKLKISARSEEGRLLPLVTTGVEAEDYVYARVLSEDRVQFGYFHGGAGGPVSAPIAIDFNKRHQVDVFMGSFLPPETHPLFKDWSPNEIFKARHRLEIKFDGSVLLSQLVAFHESGPGDIRVGPNWTTDAELEPIERLPFDRRFLDPGAAHFQGAVEMTLALPIGRAAGNDPILSTGSHGKGDLLYLTYLPAGRIRFGLDHMGDTGFATRIVATDVAKPHMLIVESAALRFAPTSGMASESRYKLTFDGETLVDVTQPTYSSRAQDVVFGLNAAGSSVSGEMFGGTLSDIRPVATSSASLPAQEGAMGAWGAVSAILLFPDSLQRPAEPIVVTGRTGAGDIVYVAEEGDGRIHFGLDHWGVGTVVGPPVKVDFKVPHRITVEMGSLYPNSMPNRKSTVRVTVDGHVVLEANWPCHPAEAGQVFIGENPIGGSTTGRLFTGRILQESRGP
jgi:hypothetical protein